MRIAAALGTMALALVALAVIFLTGLAPNAERAEPVEPSAPTRTSAPADPASAGSTPDPAEVGRSRATPAPSTPVTPPTEVVVDGAGIDATVVPVGVAADGQMELPDDPNVLGWYRHGPVPGRGSGSIVLGGHLDSQRYGVGQLARLRETEPGDVVTVGDATGTASRYKVVDVQNVARAELDVTSLFRRDGEETLVLITCGGSYDPEQGYEENLIVSAVPA